MIAGIQGVPASAHSSHETRDGLFPFGAPGHVLHRPLVWVLALVLALVAPVRVAIAFHVAFTIFG